MMTEPYSDEVRRRFSQVSHGGAAAGETASAKKRTPDLKLRLSVRVDRETVEAIKFQVWGCPHTIAACDLLCELATGQPVSTLENIDFSEIMRSLSVPVEKTVRILALEDCVRDLITAVRT